MATTEETLAAARTFIQTHGGDRLPLFPKDIERELEYIVSLAILHGERRGLKASADLVALAKPPGPACDGNAVV